MQQRAAAVVTAVVRSPFGWLLVLRAVVDERVGGAGGHGGLVGPALSTMVDAAPALRAGAPPLRRRCGPGARAARRLAYGLWVNQSLPPGGGCGLPPRALRLGRSRSGLAFAARASGAQWGGVHRRTGQRPAQPILPTTGPSPSSSGTATPSAHASCQLSCLSWEEVGHAPWYFPVSVPGLGTALGPCLGGQGSGCASGWSLHAALASAWSPSCRRVREPFGTDRRGRVCGCVWLGVEVAGELHTLAELVPASRSAFG